MRAIIITLTLIVAAFLVCALLWDTVDTSAARDHFRTTYGVEYNSDVAENLVADLLNRETELAKQARTERWNSHNWNFEGHRVWEELTLKRLRDDTELALKLKFKVPAQTIDFLDMHPPVSH